MTQNHKNQPSKRRLTQVSSITTRTQSTEIKPGTRIRFERGDGQIASDVVRLIFWQETLSEKGIALVLTNHSWCWTRDVKEVLP